MIIRETLTSECGRFASVAGIVERNAWLADNRADLIITDVLLPDGDGIDSLPGAGVDPLTPVIVLSAQNTPDTAVRATGIGRTEERRIGEGSFSTCRSRCSTYH